MPDESKIRNGRGKHILREASRAILPAEVIDRPKQGFPVPIAQWFRQRGNPFIDVLLDPESLRDGFLEADFVRARVSRFVSGADTAIELWAMLNLELWRRSFIKPGAGARPNAS